MAVKRTTGYSVWHFLFRFLGLTGLVVGIVALIVWRYLPEEDLAWQIAAGGGVALGLALLLEIRGVASGLASRKGGLASNILMQVLLAAVLVAGGNAFSYLHYVRFDWTRDGSFTLSKEIREQLAQLRGETDIIIHQRNVSFGQWAEITQEDYDLAAQKYNLAADKKIVEKVNDLAELFQDLGPRFHVQVLDIQDDYYKDKFDRIKEQHPTLADAIKKTRENSIFFYSAQQNRVQRLSFSDIYQLDKRASVEANEGKGNLVLNDQGISAFANKVFNIEEKKPRIGIAVVHEWLGIEEGAKEYGLPGLKKALASRGFETRDIILKKMLREATVLTHDENKFERVEAQRTSLERGLKEVEAESKDLAQRQKVWGESSLAELNKKYAIVQSFQGLVIVEWSFLEKIRKERGALPPFKRLTEADRQDHLDAVAEAMQENADALKRGKEKLARLNDEKSKLNVDNLAEQRRITDLRAKMNRLLADIDLLVIPRPTTMNLVRGEMIPPRIHALDAAQIDAIKDFMKTGKPVLFCLGPANPPAEAFDPSDASKDGLDDLVSSLGIQMPNQTIVFDEEAEAMSDRGERGGLPQGAEVELPPAGFEIARKGKGQTEALNPVLTSLKLTSHSFTKILPSDLRVPSPRPVYFLKFSIAPETAAAALASMSSPYGSVQAACLLASRGTRKADERAVILMSGPGSWNDEQPFASEKRVPQYERPKPDDPNKGTPQERRRGPFPIGVAVETNLPTAWYGDNAPDSTPKVRVAVLGQGGVFIGANLMPMQEKLFLDTANWLLGRDDLLSRDREQWQYPRVHLSAEQFALWQWGARLGLPLLFVYLGGVMYLVRRMR